MSCFLLRESFASSRLRGESSLLTVAMGAAVRRASAHPATLKERKLTHEDTKDSRRGARSLGWAGDDVFILGDMVVATPIVAL